MSVTIQAKSDVSYLFSNLSASSSSSGSGLSDLTGLLSDYASLKNGSYTKLMKAYYSENASDEVKSLAKNKTSTSDVLTSEESKKYATLETNADALKESADALLDASLYEEKDLSSTAEDGSVTKTTGYDVDSLYKAVNSFVTDYNSVITASTDTDDKTVSRRVESLKSLTTANTSSLAKIGIAIGTDGKLSLDKASFQSANVSTMKSLFQGNGSYGYQVSAQASLIDYAAGNVVNTGSVYTGSGKYSTTNSIGNLYSSYT